MTTDRLRIRAALPSFVGKFAALVAVGAWLGFLVGYAGRWAWPLDLFSHFRVQYAALLAISAGALLLARRPRSATLALAGAVLISTSIVGYTGWHSLPAQASAGEFRFVTFNQYFSNRDFAGIGNYLERTGADAVAMQEVPSQEVAQQLASHLPSYPHVYASSWYPYGAVIFSRWPITVGETIELVPGGARVAKAVIDWRGKPVTIMGAHLHWPIGPGNVRLRNAELQQLSRLALDAEGPLLIGGDFNITPWSPIFRDAVNASGLQDCAQGQGLIATWPAYFAPLSIRIDHCLASDDWRVVGVRTGPNLGSDHFATINDLELR